MLFSSIPFIILFLPVTLLLYFCCPVLKGRNLILLLASLLFYAWGEVRFVLIMIGTIAMNYCLGLLAGDENHSPAKRKAFLAAGITLNLAVLFLFKYLGFFEQILNSLINLFHLTGSELAVHRLILPLGISFYTFQSMSYVIDVYRNPSMVQKNILDLGLFITFFPQLIAGPIVRYQDIAGQIKKRNHSVEKFACGIERFITGLAKKVLLANTLAEAVDGILLLHWQSVPSSYLLLATVSGILQIYYDFSGYSDMAIGLAGMFGFAIKENFNYPFVSKSLTEFWRRWHISLSTWFRDYLYFPLGGNRKGIRRTVFNTLVVFTLVGLWHGASYNFVFFGFACGLVIIIERMLKDKAKTVFGSPGKTGSVLRACLLHLIYISLAISLFMFFRLDMKNAFSFYKSLFGNISGNIPAPVDVLFLTDRRFYIIFIFAVAFSFPWWPKLKIPANGFTVSVKYILLLALFVLSFGTLATDAYNPFIYFRF
ncbi:MAG: MBOAT family protein [Treponema sp.]|nr:MBOAT family protein [Treponema sp.]